MNIKSFSARPSSLTGVGGSSSPSGTTQAQSPRPGNSAVADAVTQETSTLLTPQTRSARKPPSGGGSSNAPNAGSNPPSSAGSQPSTQKPPSTQTNGSNGTQKPDKEKPENDVPPKDKDKDDKTRPGNSSTNSGADNQSPADDPLAGIDLMPIDHFGWMKQQMKPADFTKDENEENEDDEKESPFGSAFGVKA